MATRIFQVQPLHGVEPVRLGMLREQVRQELGTPENHTEAIDRYFENGFQVHYDAESRVEFIELYRDAGFVATLNGRDVFATPAAELIRHVEAPLDTSDPELGYTYQYPSIELALWRPVMPESRSDLDGLEFSSIAIGRRGYFSDRPRPKAGPTWPRRVWSVTRWFVLALVLFVLVTGIWDVRPDLLLAEVEKLLGW